LFHSFPLKKEKKRKRREGVSQNSVSIPAIAREQLQSFLDPKKTKQTRKEPHEKEEWKS
jgi:hypothetical protein